MKKKLSGFIVGHLGISFFVKLISYCFNVHKFHKSFVSIYAMSSRSTLSWKSDLLD